MSADDVRTIDQLRRALVAAGHPADTVQWADEVQRPVEGGYLSRRTDDGLVLTLVSRGEETAPEHFDSESALVESLNRRLLSPPTGAARTSDQAAADRERMQAKARATLDRIADERERS